MPKAAKTPIPAAIPPAPARAAPGPSPLPAPTRDPIADLISRWPADVPLAVLHSADPDSPYARWSLIACPSARGAGAGLLPRAPRSKPGVLLPVPVEPAERARVPASFPSLLPIARPPSIPVLIDPPGRSRSILELPPFTSGYLGYLSYDAGKLLEPRACHHPGAANDRAWPLSRWLRIDDALIYDHRHAQWWGLGNHAMLLSALAKSQEPKANSLSPLTSTTGRATFLRQVQAALDYIRAGDIYQVNLAHRLTATLQGSPRSLFLALSQSARPWYGAYLEFTDDQGRERAIASASPELFLEFDPQTRRILTRPMKGTRRGDADPNELLSSPKDQAELNMITDLMRNDLGRICEFGSVRVDSPRDLERHGRATPHTGSRSEGAHDRSHGWSTAQRCATRGQPAQDSLAPEGRTNPPSILQTTATVSRTVPASTPPADIATATSPGHPQSLPYQGNPSSRLRSPPTMSERSTPQETAVNESWWGRRLPSTRRRSKLGRWSVSHCGEKPEPHVMD